MDLSRILVGAQVGCILAMVAIGVTGVVHGCRKEKQQDAIPNKSAPVRDHSNDWGSPADSRAPLGESQGNRMVLTRPEGCEGFKLFAASCLAYEGNQSYLWTESVWSPSQEQATQWMLEQAKKEKPNAINFLPAAKLIGE